MNPEVTPQIQAGLVLVLLLILLKGCGAL